MRIRLGLAALAGACILAALPAAAMTVEEREALDLSAYRVVDTSAGYFDIAARRAELARTTDHMLLREIADVRASAPCSKAETLPVISASDPIPGFYDNRDAWRAAITPYQDFEATVSQLAAQDFVAPESGAGLCLLQLLKRWADGDALKKVDVRTSGLQTWFQVESTLFAAALSYSIVRDDIAGYETEKRRIEAWMGAVARRHLGYRGGNDGSCCNNHFYRRGVYAASIGVLTADDELFRIGISTLYSALSEATPAGALPLEMKREQNAAKYQVYAAMHLAMVAQLAARQGYDLYSLDIGGRTLKDIVGFALAALISPGSAAEASGTPDQDPAFLKDEQYYGWLELIAQRPEFHDAAQALLAARRPVFNRSLGGYLTLYFLPSGVKK